MQIILEQAEIEEALIAHVGTLGVPLDNKAIDIKLVAGRGVNGMSATIDILLKKDGSRAATIKVSQDDVSQEEEDATEEVAEDKSTPLFGK